MNIRSLRAGFDMQTIANAQQDQRRLISSGERSFLRSRIGFISCLGEKKEQQKTKHKKIGKITQYE